MIILGVILYLYAGLSHYAVAVVLDDGEDGPVPKSLVLWWFICVPILLYASTRREEAMTAKLCEHCGNPLAKHPMTFKSKRWGVLYCSGNADDAVEIPTEEGHTDYGEIAGAASSYAALACRQVAEDIRDVTGFPPGQLWRWESRFWKPSNDPLHNLVKAAALIAAEIERLNRIKNP